MNGAVVTETVIRERVTERSVILRDDAADAFERAYRVVDAADRPAFLRGVIERLSKKPGQQAQQEGSDATS